MNTGYIHINQAVKKYNKTRQTFYNYINKGYVNTKKVNNKVFLNISDIEKILNDYIQADQNIIEPHPSNEATGTIKENTNTTQNNSETMKGNRQKSFTDNISRLFQQLEEGILRSSKGQLYSNQQVISGMINEKQSDILSKIGHLSHITKKNSLRQRKTLFWMYYLVFVSINIFILRYLS